MYPWRFYTKSDTKVVWDMKVKVEVKVIGTQKLEINTKEIATACSIHVNYMNTQTASDTQNSGRLTIEIHRETKGES